MRSWRWRPRWSLPRTATKRTLAPRVPLKLAIGGDPRKPVNTKDPNRTLDRNDHIINFLNENTLEEDAVVGYKDELPDLKYDSKGVAIPPRTTKRKRKRVPITQKQTRSLYAADVIASQEWQRKFNAYMKAKGQDVQIDCGDKIVYWNSHAMVRGEQHKKIAEAYKLFRTAYEAKGLLPARRDPIPTPAERCAYLIRNYEYRFSAGLQAQRNWPRYPLTSPWPTLTLLVANDQPLREREERWEAFRDKGEFRTYGEYIGGIAQQGDMQAARRLKPYPFTYGSIQMMLKDGGVCGTMGNISARSHCTLGVPACTAGQPGHCCLILFACDPKTGTYNCHGGQYATGGDDKTAPHTPWFFGDVDAHRPMVYHQSVAWAVNYGIAAYLDSNLAYSFYRQLSEADRRAHGLKLLESGSAINPYNFLLMDAGFALAQSPAEVIHFWKNATKPFASLNRVGCPTSGLYAQTIRQKLFSSIGRLPVPRDAAVASGIFAFLREERCDNPATLAQYKVATDGLSALLTDSKAVLKSHLESTRTAATCAQMATTIAVTAGQIADKNQKREWALECWQEMQGHECYFGRREHITLDSTATILAKLTKQKLRSESEQFQPLLNQIVTQVKTAIVNGRNPKGCTQCAKTIETVAKQVDTPEQKRHWLEELARAIHGHEDYTLKNAKRLHDPCTTSSRTCCIRKPALEVPRYETTHTGLAWQAEAPVPALPRTNLFLGHRASR